MKKTKKYKIGDQVLHRYELWTIKKIDGDTLVLRGNGLETYVNVNVVWPATVEGIRIAEQIGAAYESIARCNALNWPDIHGKFCNIFASAIEASSVDVASHYIQHALDVAQHINIEVNRLSNISVGGVRIFR